MSCALLCPDSPGDDSLGFCVRFLNGTDFGADVLRHDFMRAPQCLEWSPLSEALAVGCAHGICLWRRVVADGAASAWWMTFLQHPRGGHAVEALSWSADGRFLSSVSPSKDGAVLVWDVALRIADELLTPHRPTATLSWSPTVRSHMRWGGA
mmetsp:Transcript_24750/g.55741  ORF Transcript_24750/g.55741 Transcript_24750/m.55741 type:complete len:152 (-) Transcript_24750:137-592(-)